ncbi:hypothetical protein VTN00DRAFT_7330 [Thermoascus crustaceus]|uniref:uncharacterized protein n=1 Tax=Thermoascus crustaceus TaxID=5088 RepID=UPI00374350E4
MTEPSPLAKNQNTYHKMQKMLKILHVDGSSGYLTDHHLSHQFNICVCPMLSIRSGFALPDNAGNLKEKIKGRWAGNALERWMLLSGMLTWVILLL